MSDQTEWLSPPTFCVKAWVFAESLVKLHYTVVILFLVTVQGNAYVHTLVEVNSLNAQYSAFTTVTTRQVDGNLWTIFNVVTKKHLAYFLWRRCIYFIMSAEINLKDQDSEVQDWDQDFENRVPIHLETKIRVLITSGKAVLRIFLFFLLTGYITWGIAPIRSTESKGSETKKMHTKLKRISKIENNSRQRCLLFIPSIVGI